MPKTPEGPRATEEFDKSQERIAGPHRLPTPEDPNHDRQEETSVLLPAVETSEEDRETPRPLSPFRVEAPEDLKATSGEIGRSIMTKVEESTD